MGSSSRRARPAHAPHARSSSSTKAKPLPKSALSLDQLVAGIEAIAHREDADNARDRLARALGIAIDPRLAESAKEAIGLVAEARTLLDRAVSVVTYASGDVHDVLRSSSVDDARVQCITDELAAKRVDFDVATNAAARTLFALEGELGEIEAMAMASITRASRLKDGLAEADALGAERARDRSASS